MQIQKIQNNSHKANFGAKLGISSEEGFGYITNKLYSRISKAAKEIGNDNDIVSIHFHKRYSNPKKSMQEMGTLSKMDFKRFAEVKTIINGKEKRHTVKADTNYTIEKNMHTLGDKIIGYLKYLDRKNKA